MTARPITALALATLAPHAAADFVQSTTGIPDARTTITFEEIPVKSGDPVTNQYAPLGITIDPYLYFDILKNDFPHITGHRVGYASLDPVIPFSVKFDQPRTSAAFAAASNTSNTTFEALLDGVVVEKAETKTALFNEDNFYGFTGIVFDEIRVTQFVLQGAPGMLIDTIQIGPGAGVCAPDCDANGTLDIDDFICFQTMFAIGDDYADCEQDGDLDIDDFICFQTAFALGCS